MHVEQPLHSCCVLGFFQAVLTEGLLVRVMAGTASCRSCEPVHIPVSHCCALVFAKSEDSWTVILNSKDKRPFSWEVIDLERDDAKRVVKEYESDFGELATLAVAAEKELQLVAGVDEVLNRMQRRLFDYACENLNICPWHSFWHFTE